MTKFTQRIALLRVLVVFFTFGLVGCTGVREYIHNGFKVGPNYQPPAAPVADEWIDSRSEPLQTGPGLKRLVECLQRSRFEPSHPNRE